ncbi:helix-turn-helix transcriptional regulator [Lichenifustis flavocetrariae]|uniref:AlpA family phage regulatory protein n=1 Tax=Lichenifustis flavocetrariae TaxID=2949735 RepID=A0AA41Z118_9HYPH|nr:AlpA family phage regulatory protein [Lichenifustis flavocetrariae]MCW6508455.1 AlpA family phage regulatory protein [Lichenifustis flavocetrariae]
MKSFTLPETGFMRVPGVLAIFPFSKSSLWLAVKENRFPQPVKIGPRITAWRVEDIRQHIAKIGG